MLVPAVASETFFSCTHTISFDWRLLFMIKRPFLRSCNYAKSQDILVTAASESMSNAIMISRPVWVTLALAHLDPWLRCVTYSSSIFLPDAALLLTLTGSQQRMEVTLGKQVMGCGQHRSLLRHGVPSVLLIDGRSASLPVKIEQLIYSFNFPGDVAREKFYKSHVFYVSLEVCPSLWVCWLLNIRTNIYETATTC